MSARFPSTRMWLPLQSRVRARNWFENLEDPKPENPKTLDPERRSEWDSAYKHAKKVYTSGDEGIPNLDEVCRRAAWRSVEILDGMKWPKDRTLPKAADVIGLGVFLEYGCVDDDGVLQVATFGEPDPPELLWDHKRKLLYCFPGIQLVECARIPESMSEVAEIYETWAKRPPKCYSAVHVPDYSLKPAGLMDSTSYRSDKWEKKTDDTLGEQESQSYFHAHGDDVWVYESPQKWKNGDPKALMIGGGKLDMHREGLIH